MILQAHPASYHRELLGVCRFRLLDFISYISQCVVRSSSRKRIHWELLLSSYRRGIRRQRHVLSHHHRKRKNTVFICRCCLQQDIHHGGFVAFFEDPVLRQITQAYMQHLHCTRLPDSLPTRQSRQYHFLPHFPDLRFMAAPTAEE